MMRDILRRKRVGRITFRVLECGHEQRQKSGGQAKTAVRCFCFTCSPEGGAAPGIQRPTIGTCTAIRFTVRGQVGICGEPAKYLKRGQPRCGIHNARGAR